MALETPATAHDTDEDVIFVSSKYVKCDGGGGPLGHPVSWMDMGDDDSVVCKYCGRIFQLKPGLFAPAGH